MFGDYFERYWDHSRSLFMQDRFELDSLNLNLLRAGELLLYCRLLFCSYLLKIRNSDYINYPILLEFFLY